MGSNVPVHMELPRLVHQFGMVRLFAFPYILDDFQERVEVDAHVDFLADSLYLWNDLHICYSLQWFIQTFNMCGAHFSIRMRDLLLPVDQPRTESIVSICSRDSRNPAYSIDIISSTQTVDHHFDGRIRIPRVSARVDGRQLFLILDISSVDGSWGCFVFPLYDTFYSFKGND